MEELEKPLVKQRLETIDEENQLDDPSSLSPSSISSDILCHICFEQTDMVTLPCTHTICKICILKLKKKECPFCRKTFRVKSKCLVACIQELQTLFPSPIQLKFKFLRELNFSCNVIMSAIIWHG